ncbi:MAG: diguanylate cyclase domain-containing protein [Pirellula sp.]
MSFLRFVTVDMLCIAAEISAALLLLAFAIPEKKSTAQADANNEELDRLSAQARQFCVDSAVFLGLAILRAPDRSSFHETEDMAETLRLVGYEDKLTHTANHAFTEAFLTKWLRLPIEHRTGSSLAMIVVDDYSDMLRTKGAMELEAILRKLSEMIKSEFGSTSIISRYQPDRFLILSFDGDIGNTYTDLVALRKKVSEIELDETTGHGAFDCTNSIVHLGDENVNLQQAIEDLDEGIIQASGSTDKCVAKVANQEWSDSALLSANIRADAANRKTDLQADQSGSASSASSETEKQSLGKTGIAEEPIESAAPIGNVNAVPAAQDKGVADSPASKETKPQSDVQAVAKSEDIEALFEQIKKNKKSNAATAEVPAEPSSQKPAIEVPSTKVSEMDVSESATADDIAALFATVKSATQTSTPKTEEAPASNPVSNTTEDENGVASADDIAALFASVQSTPKAPQATADAGPLPAPTSPSTDLDKLDEAVSADDIASLFAMAKSDKQEAEPQAQPTPPPVPSKAGKSPNVNQDESVSPNDIAALFAAAKKPAPSSSLPMETASNVAESNAPPFHATPEGKKNIQALVQNLNESASADEIESLFSNLK